MAILLYLSDKAGHDRFWPRDMHARGLAYAMCAEMQSGFAPLRSACLGGVLPARALNPHQPVGHRAHLACFAHPVGQLVNAEGIGQQVLDRRHQPILGLAQPLARTHLAAGLECRGLQRQAAEHQQQGCSGG
jgi:glutathione S-transferase